MYWPKLDGVLNRRALASNILAPRLIEKKKNLPGRGMTKIENHLSRKCLVNSTVLNSNGYCRQTICDNAQFRPLTAGSKAEA
jgi:hypothetical protein